jgi:hypothetical protein
VTAPKGIASRAAFGKTLNEEVDESNLPAISAREAAPDSATNLLGINCRGSGRCNATCGRSTRDLRDWINKLRKSALAKNANESFH